MKKICLLLFLLTTSILNNAQTTGFVFDNNNQPIEGVNVLIVDKNLLLETNSEGIFFVDEKIEKQFKYSVF